MKASAARVAFRNQLASKTCVYPASVFDPISGRLAQDTGFEVGMFAGSTAAMSVLAAPDLIVLTLGELAEQARRICRASSLPILVDADHGYGGVLNVRRTVEELENAGIAALTIEDTLLPTPFGASGKAALIPVEEGVAKMRAALAARTDPLLTIIGRTSAPQITDMADTLARTKAYEAAGVDAVFLVGVKTWEQLAEIRAALKVPVLLGNAAQVLMDRERLGGLGVPICLQGHQSMAAVVQALHSTYRALRDGVELPADSLAPQALMQQVSRAALYEEWLAPPGG
ncbi:MAG: isocitrate lyase/PEP mutase family protein [Polaromonas sp.]|uniref:isocitrate lyase/PEP mutase family protein n=1 Tax=Polaromonas sp. TaxID=1869339 RepID=UPI0025EEA0EA|nr:isocitrate lyase/PEP mutase family protein [Polaromonas sp.]MBI2729017.1 isocitrate lyase/PEP mutase family protein [Polaromonas sp.]